MKRSKAAQEVHERIKVDHARRIGEAMVDLMDEVAQREPEKVALTISAEMDACWSEGAKRQAYNRKLVLSAGSVKADDIVIEKEGV